MDAPVVQSGDVGSDPPVEAPWRALIEFSSSLALATRVSDTGRAVHTAVRSLGLSDVVLVDTFEAAGRLEVSIAHASRDDDAVDIDGGVNMTVVRNLALMCARERSPFRLSPACIPHLTSESLFFDARNGSLVVPVQDERGLHFGIMTGRHERFTESACALFAAVVHAAQSWLVERCPQAPTARLTKRELECLRWLTDGKTDGEVGEILSISARTVRFHMSNIKAKLGVATRIQVVAKGFRGSS